MKSEIAVVTLTLIKSMDLQKNGSFSLLLLIVRKANMYKIRHLI